METPSYEYSILLITFLASNIVFGISGTFFIWKQSLHTQPDWTIKNNQTAKEIQLMNELSSFKLSYLGQERQKKIMFPKVLKKFS